MRVHRVQGRTASICAAGTTIVVASSAIAATTSTAE
ncbi:hypothetical protein M2322_004689 [Rhodoblastus acidophilus]|nr:hypothetical protein [Rhodoblastus acidophilus]